MPLPHVGVFGRNAAPCLEIKPESPFVVFYGESSEAHETELKGKLILNNPESMSVRSIRITLTGTRKVSWHLTNTVSPQPITEKRTFLTEELNLFPVEAGSKTKAHKLNSGYHAWDFSFKLPPNLDQSVEGLPTNYIVYDLKASVDRGYMSKQLSAMSHIRVIRTLGRDMLESMPMEQINEDIWANKLAYKITVPQKNYIVGTQVIADFVLIPLRKGVEISTIKMELIESRQLFADYAGRRVSHSMDTPVAVIESNMPENSAHMVPDSMDDADALYDESHRFAMTLDLPKSLKNCRQSVDTENIRLSHKLRLYVNLKNPEGHTSQLLVKNHIHLFISPNLPPNEDQSVVVDQNILNAQALQDEVNQNAPPTYARHQLDELYNDIDPAGFMTPGFHSRMNSGANTPFYAHSRSGSAEDLTTSLNAVANQTGGGASAIALQYRLQNLNLNQDDRPSRFAPSRQHSSGDSTPAPSSEPAYFDLPTSNYDMDALVRTPSYNTALRTPAGSRTPGSIDVALPSYEIAMSRPSSPSRSRGSRGTTPSPARSLDTLNEETYRNTQINSRRESPRESGRQSPEDQ
ncbi:carbon catabolite repression protein cred [Clathrospora elynae]|uniref:Carbon catabolite repression protein cred n=1 Tax=Clathrospora elynae TaxID=706981 RepID=A0A6A5SPM5_9PLEO|nr:carbon catabolite repression protein cred [Clathrospora elynae]